MTWKKYRRTGLSEMRPYVPGEDLTNISVSYVDRDNIAFDLANGRDPGGMVARNPDDHTDQWYVSQDYFEKNLEEA